jgi:hypothetical protein
MRDLHFVSLCPVLYFGYARQMASSMLLDDCVDVLSKSEALERNNLGEAPRFPYFNDLRHVFLNQMRIR